MNHNQLIKDNQKIFISSKNKKHISKIPMSQRGNHNGN